MNYNFTCKNIDLNKQKNNQSVYIKGWVVKIRKFKKMFFFDLLDSTAVVQVVINQENSTFTIFNNVKTGDLLTVSGKVVLRKTPNSKLITGEIEILLNDFKIINKTKTLPIDLYQDNSLEETNLKYRYLDLRKIHKKDKLIKRHQIMQIIRNVLIKKNFLELETPVLGLATPEGSRDFVVPSRIYPGFFYALTQSPQIFKQLYMIAGFDKYFQFSRCFRDEDSRSDRTLEFTQIDIEAAFVKKENFYVLIENIFKKLLKKFFKKTIKTPFSKISFQEAITKYGTDKPDLRFNLIIQDWSSSFEQKNKENIFTKGFSFAIKKDFLKILLQKITFFCKQKQETFFYFFDQKNTNLDNLDQKILQKSTFFDKKLFYLLFISKNEKKMLSFLGEIRLFLGQICNFIDYNKQILLWVENFPLFELNEQQEITSVHHPFTAPLTSKDLTKNPLTIQSQAYDLVWNGFEVGGGSIRNFKTEDQLKIFQILKLSPKEIKKKFGFFLEALSYATPPHGGIALGLERIVMLITNTNNIKDVVGFPKTQTGRDLMLQTPNLLEEEKLEELNIIIKKGKK